MIDYLQIEPTRPYQKGMCSIFSFTCVQPTARKLGIDVNAKKEDIKLLFYKRQAPSIAKEGLDPEDVLQEVYKGILIRNEGSCPYDPEKSAFSTYVVMVMNCICMNIIKKHRKDKDRFELGREDDFASSYEASYEEDPSDALFLEEVRSHFKDDLLKVYDALMGGYKISHLGKVFGWDTRVVSHYVQEVRKKVAYLLDRKDLLPC